MKYMLAVDGKAPSEKAAGGKSLFFLFFSFLSVACIVRCRLIVVWADFLLKLLQVRATEPRGRPSFCLLTRLCRRATLCTWSSCSPSWAS